jgi:hypothetical protein
MKREAVLVRFLPILFRVLLKKSEGDSFFLFLRPCCLVL